MNWLRAVLEAIEKLRQDINGSKAPHIEKQFLSTEEAAAYLGLGSKKTLYNLVSQGRCPVRSYKIGRLRKFKKAGLEAFGE